MEDDDDKTTKRLFRQLPVSTAPGSEMRGLAALPRRKSSVRDTFLPHFCAKRQNSAPEAVPVAPEAAGPAVLLSIDNQLRFVVVKQLKTKKMMTWKPSEF